ncbi:MAG TPA: DUF1707 domain-containing protein [Solirubrobacteraceae bacterium]
MYETGPRPDLRASDAERERVAAFLRDQAAEGRLDADELDERVGKAYAAKTVRELQGLMADLPRAPFARARPARPRSYAPAPRHGVPPAVVPLGILAFLAFGGPGLVWAVAWIGTALAVTGLVLALVLGAVLSPFLIVAAIVILALRRRRPRRWDWDPRWR